MRPPKPPPSALPSRLAPAGSISILALAAALAACSPSQSQGPGGMPQGPAEVAAVTVKTERLAVPFEFPAQVHGAREVEIRARVNGILERRNYREGDTVKAGSSLFTIDRAPFETALARAEADLASAEARLAQARREAARLKPLVDAKAIAQQEYDNAVSTQTVSEAELRAAQARLREARLNLGYTRVESPITGVASRALKSEGSLVSGPDVLLTTVTQVDPVHVRFGMPDIEHLRIRRGIEDGSLALPEKGNVPVRILLADGSHFDQAGALDFSDVRVNEQTGTSEARAVVPNPKRLLRPGQFVRVQFDGAVRPAAVKLPQRAVLEGPKGKFVYVIAEGKAQARPVQVAEWSGDQLVVTEGLKDGEQVIVDGVLKIGPGAPVKPAAPKAAQSGETAVAQAAPR